MPDPSSRSRDNNLEALIDSLVGEAPDLDDEAVAELRRIFGGAR